MAKLSSVTRAIEAVGTAIATALLGDGKAAQVTAPVNSANVSNETGLPASLTTLVSFVTTSDRFRFVGFIVTGDEEADIECTVNAVKYTDVLTTQRPRAHLVLPNPEPLGDAVTVEVKVFHRGTGTQNFAGVLLLEN